MEDSAIRLRAANKLAGLLGDDLDLSGADRGFSPFYSDVGLEVDEGGGIAALFLYYNRRKTIFLKPFLRLPDPEKPHLRSAAGITQHLGRARARIAFCSHNTWVVDCEGLPGLEFNPAGHPGLTEKRRREVDRRTLIFDGYLPTVDRRDPDFTFPFVLGLRIVRGAAAGGDGLVEPLRIDADSRGRLVLVFTARVLEVDHHSVITRLKEASSSAAAAMQRTMAWWAEAMGGLDLAAGDPAEGAVLARAVYTLLSNSAACPGLLQDRIGAFPSRGTYPSPYLWDSCFQNLGTELFNPRLAADSLMLFVENLRVDGKMPAFLCSTWVHPGQSQPPLVGWAAARLVEKTGDERLAARLLPGLRRNTRWWLSQRMTRFGLVAALNGMEVGWDDSPRFDQGPIVACDLNSYLLLQMRACAQFARMGGDEAGAEELGAQAEAYAARMVEVLYDRETGLFWDLSVEHGHPVRIKTPACFLPLLAGVPLPPGAAKRAVADYLLNPACFFAEVPFPVVAYDEPSYQSGKWWRGPTWINVAYLMLMVLDRLDFTEAAASARERLYRMMVADGNLRELFDSQTGEGLGAFEYGWTAAICLRLHQELGEP